MFSKPKNLWDSSWKIFIIYGQFIFFHFGSLDLPNSNIRFMIISLDLARKKMVMMMKSDIWIILQLTFYISCCPILRKYSLPFVIFFFSVWERKKIYPDWPDFHWRKSIHFHLISGLGILGPQSDQTVSKGTEISAFWSTKVLFHFLWHWHRI